MAKNPQKKTTMCVDFDLNCPQIDSAEKLGRQKQQRQQPKAPAPAASSAHNKTTPWRREGLGARPPPGTNSPTANKRQPREPKGGPQNKQLKPNPRGSQRKPDHPKGPREGANENVTTSRLPDQAHGNNGYSWYTEVQIDCCTSTNQLGTEAMSTL